MNTRQAIPWLVAAGALLVLIVSVGPGLTQWFRHNVEWGVQETAVDSLTRDLQPGMPLEEVTDYLRRRGIAFTVQPGDDGPVIAGIGRDSSREGRTTRINEHQIAFDAQHRLRGFLVASTIRSD